MPIFEYVCKQCGKAFEKLQLAGRESEVKCPDCGRDEVEKKISAPFLPSSVGAPANENRSSCSTGKAAETGCQPGG